MSTVSKESLLAELRRLLSEAFENQRQGAVQSRLGRSYGYIDGYMRVLIDTGVVSERELLAVVAAERTRHAGPATQTFEPRAA